MKGYKLTLEFKELLRMIPIVDFTCNGYEKKIIMEIF